MGASSESYGGLVRDLQGSLRLHVMQPEETPQVQARQKVTFRELLCLILQDHFRSTWTRPSRIRGAMNYKISKTSDHVEWVHGYTPTWNTKSTSDKKEMIACCQSVSIIACCIPSVTLIAFVRESGSDMTRLDVTWRDVEQLWSGWGSFSAAVGKCFLSRVRRSRDFAV